MGIGGALAAARSEAGMTIDQVSERTRIRATIIRAIERDDYSVCGGDFYARGHIRAIARAVGTDPAPLVEQYDLAHAPPPAPTDSPGDQARGHGAGGHATWQATGDGGSRLLKIGGISSASGAEKNGAGNNGFVRPGGITAAEAFRPAMPLKIEGTRRLPVRAGMLALVLLAAIGVLAYFLATGGAPAARTTKHSTSKTHHPVATAPASPSASIAPSPSASALPVASATAFGPAGTSQGDNPSMAALAIDGSNSTAWQTDWYATADLNGQSGSGLLLDMGSSVNISEVSLLLGPTAGGTVQLRAGNTPSLADMPVVAQAANPGGTLNLRPSSPVSAQYALVWFTSLPPDSAGTYQAFLYNVTVSGTS